MDDRITGILEALNELTNDNTVPRNIKNKVESVITMLKDDTQDMSIKIDKALGELDDISEDSNLQPYTRTQVWNISSMLETVA